MFWFYLGQIIAMTISRSLDDFEEHLDNNQLQMANNLIEKLYRKEKGNKLVAKKYSEFLVKKGEYAKALGIENIEKKYRLKISEIQKKSFDLKKNIKILISESPFSLEVRLQQIKNLLSVDLDRCNKFLSRTEFLYKDNNRVKHLRAVYYAYKLKHDLAIKSLLDINSGFAQPYKNFSKILEGLKNEDFDSVKTRELLNNIYRSYIKSTEPSIFRALLIQALIFFLRNVTDNFHSASYYGKMLIDLEKSDLTRFLYTRSLIIDKKITEAKKEIPVIENASYQRTLNIMVKNYEDEETRKKEDEEKKKKEEEKKKQQQQQQYNYNQGQQQSNNRDSLGYYKTLGLTPTATDREIKKKYIKRVLELDPEKSKKKLTDSEKEKMNEELAKVNQARDTLMNKEKRSKYDAGLLDQQRSSGHGGYADAASNEQIQQMIEAFFGGGSRGRRQSNQQYYYSSSGGSQQGGYGRQQTFFFV